VVIRSRRDLMLEKRVSGRKRSKNGAMQIRRKFKSKPRAPYDEKGQKGEELGRGTEGGGRRKINPDATVYQKLKSAPLLADRGKKKGIVAEKSLGFA